MMVTSRQKVLAFVNAAGINLLVCGLARHPLVVNAIFLSICSIPQSAPLVLRKRAAEAYHYGGIHSGCGVAAFSWYTGLVALISREYWINQDSGMISVPVIVLSYVLLLVLVVIIAVAHPKFRTERHDYFELTHRFLAWLAVALFLTLLLVFSDQARLAQGLSLGQYLVEFPAFWFVLGIIASIVHPWLLLRRVQVRPEYLSPHAIRLHLRHTSTAFGKVIALSEHPLRDWHSFATFPDPDGKSFSCIVSKAGNWTTRCIDQQPTQLWKRGVLMYGFIHVMRVFRRVVVVATGSGIGPCLSFLSEKNRPSLRVIWQTRNPNRTYGRDVLNLVRQLDSNPLLIDTGNSGRVDMVPIIQELVREFDAEAVCVISNPRLTKKVVFELKANGVPAFGPIFDS
jgi:NAD(P)H-flavin reductase